jgi:hypothetical protein
VIDLVDAYLKDAEARRKPRSFVEIERSLKRAVLPCTT